VTARRVLATALLAALAGCAGQKPARDYTKLVNAQVRSILVVPPVSKAVDVTAPDLFLTAIPMPLAERGYYVFPVNMVKRVLEDDGLSDAGMVHAADPARLASIFGADAVLYVTIERWDARYLVFDTTATVAAHFVLKDGRTGEPLWQGGGIAMRKSSGGGGSLIQLVVDVVASAAAKAAPDYVPLARAANGVAFRFPGMGFPAGPLHPEHGHDWAGVPPGMASVPAERWDPVPVATTQKYAPPPEHRQM
jgi:hypothetical protein